MLHGNITFTARRHNGKKHGINLEALKGKEDYNVPIYTQGNINPDDLSPQTR